MDVMRATGARVGLPSRGGDCCGALHVHAGRTRLARKLARRVIASVPGDAAVVVDSAGCGAAMKDYGRLLGTAEAEAFSARVRDFSEWLADQPALALRDTGRDVVVQDPCHLRHVQKVEGAVRAVLAPAYRLHDTADDGLCCGAGGAYAVLEPELATEIRLRKVEAIRRAAARSTRSSSRPTPGVPCTSPRSASTSATRPNCSPTCWKMENPVAEVADIVEALRAIEEQLRDLAYDRLRAANEDGGGAAAAALAEEKRVLQARRAVERAINALAPTTRE